MTQLKIERRGGFGGFGLPGARIKSEGRVALNELSGSDRQTVERLFASNRMSGASHPDGFTYRITRITPDGEEVVEVPEADVPSVLVNAVKDELT